MNAALNTSLARYAMAVFAHLALLLAWYLFVRLGEVPRFVMPSPGDTLQGHVSHGRGIEGDHDVGIPFGQGTHRGRAKS